MASVINHRKVLAVDTEFARFNTYYPMVGLIQIFDGDTCYLIDPLAVEDLSPLKQSLTNPEIVKVFHASSEDMEVFQHCLGIVPAPVFDSQIAAAALGIGFSLGYQAMVQHYLDVTIPKEETRSDWLQRPLTESQLEYAALDVVYLYQIHKLQVEQLDELGRLTWVMEESGLGAAELPTTIEPDSAYLKAKGLSGLGRKQLAVIKSLYAWREVTARQKNVPRNRIVDPKGLVVIAKEQMLSKQMLQSAAGMTPRQVRKYGDDLLFIAAEARKLPEDQWPPIIQHERIPVDSKQVKRLRDVAERVADQMSISPELLVKRRDIEMLLRSGEKQGQFELPNNLRGWRREVVGDELLKELAG